MKKTLLDDKFGSVADCFNPRFGLEAFSGSDRCDFLICFECGTAEMYRDDVRTTYVVSQSGLLAFKDLTKNAVPLKRVTK